MANAGSVLVTGASGYIAKHIVVQLLNAGFTVTGSLRRLDRAGEVRAAVLPHLTDAADLDKRLRFVTLDLERDDGWTTALQGIDALIHTASPFPLVQPKDEDDLIRPAVQGALRALRAAHAAGVGRVVMTSSSAAVMVGDHGERPADESDWSDLSAPGASAYVKSKTLAERAAWDFVATTAPDMALTVINPVLVLGPPLDAHYGSSVSIIQRVLTAKDPAVPRIGFPVVDVRDVALMHLRALQQPETAGKRYIASDRFMWFEDIAKTLATAYPNRKIVTRVAPTILLRLLAIFDPVIRGILPMLGKREDASNARARAEMGMVFIPAADSLRATAQVLLDQTASR